jgi:transcription initiation factor TFIIB
MYRVNEAGRSPRTTHDHDQCPDCDGSLRTGGHETVCEDCGLIFDDQQIDRGPEYRAFTHDERIQRERTGAPLTPTRHDRGLSTELNGTHDANGNSLSSSKRRQLARLRREQSRGRWRSKAERNLADGLGEVQRIASALDCPDSITEQACVLFRRAHGKELCPGRSLDGIAAASVFAACRCAGLGLTRQDLEGVTQYPRSHLDAAYTVMNMELELPTEVLSPCDLIDRYASELELSMSVRCRAREFAVGAEQAGVTIGQKPSAVAAGCLYGAVEEGCHTRTQDEIATVAGVSTATLRKHWRTVTDVAHS